MASEAFLDALCVSVVTVPCLFSFFLVLAISELALVPVSDLALSSFLTSSVYFLSFSNILIASSIVLAPPNAVGFLRI